MCEYNCPSYVHAEEAPLAPWERELLTGYREGEGDMVVTRLDGEQITIPKIRVDSIGVNRLDGSVTEVETFDGKVFGIPLVAYWTIDYP